ncbi:MAG: hypothetical protein AAGF83_03640 [Cyanobacteria bacterium P01_G01_bin.67]
MKAEKLEPIKAHTDAIAKLLYEETDSEQVNVTLHCLETSVTGGKYDCMY